MSPVYVTLFVLILVVSFSCVLCQSRKVSKAKKPKVKNLNLPEGAECEDYGSKGICVNAYKCPNILYTIKVDFHPFPALCTFKDDVPIVCCTACELVEDIRKITYIIQLGMYYQDRGRLSDLKCLQYLEELPYGCKGLGLALEYGFDIPLNLPEGREECTRLYVTGGWTAVDGIDALRGEFPHMALLGYGEDLDSAQYLCGGSVISEKYILTAAHCIASAQLGPVKYVALGILKRTDPPELWQRYDVKRIIPHPEYKSPSKYHDIALLEIENEIKFNETVLPACLNTDKHEYSEEISHDYFFKEMRKVLDAEKRETYATGWGRLGENQRLADNLQKVKLEEYADEDCSKLYQVHRHMDRGYDNITQMCFGDYTGIADTCSGDSGGPLQVNVRANVFDCQFKVIGVVSSGNPCGTKGGAGLYTRVDYYIPWIESVVWPDEKF